MQGGEDADSNDISHSFSTFPPEEKRRKAYLHRPIKGGEKKRRPLKCHCEKISPSYLKKGCQLANTRGTRSPNPIRWRARLDRNEEKANATGSSKGDLSASRGLSSQLNPTFRKKGGPLPRGKGTDPIMARNFHGGERPGGDENGPMCPANPCLRWEGGNHTRRKKPPAQGPGPFLAAKGEKKREGEDGKELVKEEAPGKKKEEAKRTSPNNE